LTKPVLVLETVTVVMMEMETQMETQMELLRVMLKGSGLGLGEALFVAHPSDPRSKRRLRPLKQGRTAGKEA
jgi:hypothetical protein